MATTLQEQHSIKMNKSIHASNSAVLSDCEQILRFFPVKMEALQEPWLLSKKLTHFSAKEVKYFFPTNNCFNPAVSLDCCILEI